MAETGLRLNLPVGPSVVSLYASKAKRKPRADSDLSSTNSDLTVSVSSAISETSTSPSAATTVEGKYSVRTGSSLQSGKSTKSRLTDPIGNVKHREASPRGWNGSTVVEKMNSQLTREAVAKLPTRKKGI